MFDTIGGMTMDETPDFDALVDLATPWCLRVVATLGIAEAVEAGETTLEALAATTDSDRHALGAVMRHLVGKGVFTEPEPGSFALNAVAQNLLDPARRLELDLNGIGGRMAHTWGTLPRYVQTGMPTYDDVFGMSFWQDLAAHPDVAASFDAFMGAVGHGVPDPDFLLSGDWESIQTVVDVGGGSGAMLAEILRAHPHLMGILVDLPGTVARSAPVFAAAGVAERVTVAGQSFFDALPSGADMYVLHKVLNDWPDRETTAILRRCAEAAHLGSWVIVLGGVTSDEAPPSLGIDMLLVGGKSDTLTVFRRLADDAGLEVVAAGRPASGRFVVQCRRSG